MVGGAVSFASEGQRLSRTSRDSLRAVAVEDQTAASEEAHRTGISKGGSAADDGLARDDLDPEDFDSALASYDLVLVNFYAPWCPHCIQVGLGLGLGLGSGSGLGSGFQSQG